MSFWQILGRFAVSEAGETLQKHSNTTSVSSDGTTYTKMGSTTAGSDGTFFTQMGGFITDGSIRMGNATTGLRAVFNNPWNDLGVRSSLRRDVFDNF